MRGRLLLRRRTFDVQTDVGRLRVHADDEIITPVLREQGRMPDADVELLRTLALGGAAVVDVGANIGYTTLLLARAVGRSGCVFAVEPHPANARLLRVNVRRNRARRVVRVIEAAAWRSSGSVPLSQCESNTGDHRVGALLDQRPVLQVPAIRLDEVIAPTVQVRLVLLDTQGTEHVALAGAQQVLQRSRPVILTEFWPKGISTFGDDPLVVLAGYRALGYRLRVVELPELGEEASDQAIVSTVEARRADEIGGFATLQMFPIL